MFTIDNFGLFVEISQVLNVFSVLTFDDEKIDFSFVEYASRTEDLL